MSAKGLDRLFGKKEFKEIYIQPPTSRKNNPQGILQLDKFLSEEKEKN